jgi:TPP-dependent trihydroxycyclohexane-1,2-dione (THcHDO) dehydratase
MPDYPMIRFAYNSGLQAGLEAAAHVFSTACMQPVVKQLELADELAQSLNSARDAVRSSLNFADRRRYGEQLLDALGRPQ